MLFLKIRSDLVRTVWMTALCLLALSAAFAQGPRSANDLTREAEKLMVDGDLQQAVKKLLEALRQKEGFVPAYCLLGRAYALQAAPEKSVEAFEEAISRQPNYSRAMYFECAESYMKVGNYAKALEKLEFFKKSPSEQFKASEAGILMAYEMRLERVIASCRYGLSADPTAPVDLARPLGEGLNTPQDEYMPALSADGRILLFTRRDKQEDIFMAAKSDGLWGDSRAVRYLNSVENEGMVRFVGCGTTIYFAGCNRANGRGGCDVFVADLDTLEQPVPQPLDGALNLKSWDSQPALSTDGTGMIFASNREGGFGGSDLWYSRCVDGYWEAATNLGRAINTPGDEESPFLSLDGRNLYFSSDGHPGFGEADLFRAVLGDDGVWGSVENLGRVINSAYRETGFCLAFGEKEAFFASARAGGQGGLDLYRAALPEKFAPQRTFVLVCGTIAAPNGVPLAAHVRFRADGKDIYSVASDKTGRFTCSLPSGEFYSFIGGKKGYETHYGAELIEGTPEKPFFSLQVVLEPLPGTPVPAPAPVPRKPGDDLSSGAVKVFFEKNLSEFSEAEKNKLTELLDRFANRQKLSVLVLGYANDERDGDGNLRLSTKRAQSVARLLEQLGVPRENMVVEGKGEPAAGSNKGFAEVFFRVN